DRRHFAGAGPKTGAAAALWRPVLAQPRGRRGAAAPPPGTGPPRRHDRAALDALAGGAMVGGRGGRDGADQSRVAPIARDRAARLHPFPAGTDAACRHDNRRDRGDLGPTEGIRRLCLANPEQEGNPPRAIGAGSVTATGFSTPEYEPAAVARRSSGCTCRSNQRAPRCRLMVLVSSP